MTVDVGKNASVASSNERRGFERDAPSRSLVFRVTDTISGDVILQIPDEIVLKARSYAEKDAAPVGVRIEKRA